MNSVSTLTPNQDDRIMAALAHISVLLPFLGLVVPIVIWVTQKDKSQFVRFQALQALTYQLTMILAYFVGMGCYMCSIFANFLPLTFASSTGQESTIDPLLSMTFFLPLAVFGAIFIVGIAFVIYGVVGAVMTFQGRPFRYVLIGTRVEKFLLQE